MIQEQISKTKDKVILVVDDYPYNLSTVESILSKNGYKNISMASSGSDALSLIDEKKPDLVLLDIMMPDMDGFEVCKILHDDKETSDIPVIMLTARTSSKDLKRGFEVGAVDYIEKPFDKIELMARIEAALKIKESKDKLRLYRDKQVEYLDDLVRARTSELERTNEQLRWEIAERKYAEMAVRESEEKFRTIFENADDEIIYLDKYGMIVDINRRIEDIFGYRPEEVIGKSFAELGFFKIKDLPRMIGLFKGAIEGGEAASLLDLEIAHKNGNTVFVEASTRLIKKNGKIEGVLVIVRDVTDRKVAEEDIRQKNEELKVMGDDLIELNLHLEQKVEERTEEIEKILKHKNEFISQMGHDIKTPLTPLISLLPFIEKNEVDPKSKDLLKICIRNVHYIKNLVVNTLQLARLNSKDTVFDINEINIKEIVDSVIFDHQTIIEDRDIEVEQKIDGDITVFADSLRLREVFSNLISNAIKFMDGEGKLTIDMEKMGEEFAIVSVRDTGIGLDDEVKSHLFEEFYKADKSRHELDSSGLGLVICKRIIEKHGGKIWAYSPGAGEGTTFYFTIPIKREIKTKIEGEEN